MKWWLKVIIIVVAILIVAFIGLSAYLGASATKVERNPVEGNPADLGLDYEDIEFPSSDDELIMHGWYLPCPDSEQVIIMLHGADGNRASPSVDMLGIAAELVANGYSILMFDMRGHGESEGDRLSAGYHERKDLLGALDYVQEVGFKHIGVLGFSMGAATALLTAAENTDIDCVVADSSFADMTGIIEREFTERTGFPGFLLPPVIFMVNIMYGVDFNAVKPVESVPDIAPRPVLFIHGEEDTFTPLEHAHRLINASQNPQDELWIAPNATHVRTYVNNRTEYINRVIAFFDEALKQE